jgi:hypothetical protein
MAFPLAEDATTCQHYLFFVSDASRTLPDIVIRTVLNIAQVISILEAVSHWRSAESLTSLVFAENPSWIARLNLRKYMKRGELTKKLRNMDS